MSSFPRFLFTSLSSTTARFSGWTIEQRRVLLLLVLLSLVHGMLYAAFVLPWWQVPDEGFHFFRSHVILSNIRGDTDEEVLRWQDEQAESIYYEFPYWLWDSSGRYEGESVRLPERYFLIPRQELAYLLFALAALPFATGSILVKLYAMRVLSVVIGVGITAVSFVMAADLFPKDRFMQLLLPFFTMFVPAYAIVACAVTDSNLANLCVLLVFYAAMLTVRDGVSWQKGVFALVFTVMAIWAKSTAYFLLPLWGLVGVWVIWRFRRKPLAWVSAGGALAVLYFVFPSRGRFFVWLAYTWFKRGHSTVEVLNSPHFFTDLHDRFWYLAGFGVEASISPMWYLVIKLAYAAAAAGLVILAFRYLRNRGGGDAFSLKVLGLCALFFVVHLAVVLSFSVLTGDDSYRHGRYLHVVMPPFVIVLLLGWRELFPKSMRGGASLYLAAALLLFDFMAFGVYTLPWLYHMGV